MPRDLQDNSVSCNHRIADDAFAVYSAMKRAEVALPDLAKFGPWLKNRTLAYVMFLQAFEVSQ